MGDVLLDEFMHWHQCDMLAISRDEAEAMITSIASILNKVYVDYENDLYDTTKFLINDFVGKPYFIFDMNGRVLSKGIAGKTIKMPQSHAILKIDGEVRMKK